MAQLNEWLSISKTSGTGNAEITLTASSYEELTQRTESLVVKGQSENKKVYVNVIQNASEPSATLDSYGITAYRGGTYTNGITSNVPWTAVVDGDWITIDKTSGQRGYTPLSITIDASTETRRGSIIFNAKGVVLTLQIYQIYDLDKSYFWVEFENTGARVSGLTNSIVNFIYSFDGETWETAPSKLSMGEFKKVYLQNSTKILNTDSVTTTLKFSKYSKIGGDMSSIVDMAESCCANVFKENALLTDASELILPWTTLADSCYAWMFYNCPNLRTAPKLPATTLAYWCYEGMFFNCTNLTTAPVLPATTLAYACYQSMFAYCSSLRTAPKLPATTLEIRCYDSMFRDCSSLTTAPVLPATTLVESCYYGMFENCKKLTYIKMLATDISAFYCLMYWAKNVSTTGTFIKHPDAELPSGESSIPNGWTVETATE